MGRCTLGIPSLCLTAGRSDLLAVLHSAALIDKRPVRGRVGQIGVEGGAETVLYFLRPEASRLLHRAVLSQAAERTSGTWKEGTENVRNRGRLPGTCETVQAAEEEICVF